MILNNIQHISGSFINKAQLCLFFTKQVKGYTKGGSKSESEEIAGALSLPILV
jgi:hypothetical protein